MDRCIEITSKEHLQRCVAEHDDNFSILLLYASWNQKKYVSIILPLFNTLLVNTVNEECGKDTNRCLQAPCFCLQADRDEETLTFCIGDTKQTMNRKDTDGDIQMQGHDSHEMDIQLKCPDELPAFFVLGRFNGKVHAVQVQLNQREILFFSEQSTRVAIQQAVSSFHDLSNGNMQRPSLDRKLKKRRNTLSREEHNNQIRLFIAGDRTQVGKSSVCLGILGTLLRMNYPPSSLAYIKPATQCEQVQLVTEYCKKNGIQSCPVGPIVYYRGFTRAFLNKETESSETLLEKVSLEVDKIAKDKSVVIIDGVGYPAVGSITDTDNARVARASGYPSKNGGPRTPAAVLLVGKSGVGDAVDSYNLNSTYFRYQNIPVVGAVFNRLSRDGYYSLENCKRAVSSYFEQNSDRLGGEQVFGFIPEVEDIANSRMECDDEHEKARHLNLALAHADTFITLFDQHVDVRSMLERAASLRDDMIRDEYLNTRFHEQTSKRVKLRSENIDEKLSDAFIQVPLSGEQFEQVSLTREQIEQRAREAGAKGG